MKPLVSVCVPTYNGASFLAGCLESVLAQTFCDFEVLVVDDCSSDQSAEIAGAHARQDARVRTFVNQSNLGLVGNWNRCAQLARGEWVKFVFQDDLILPGCLEAMLTAAAGSKVAIVSCARDFIFEAGTSEGDRDFYLENRAHIVAAYRDANHWPAQRCAEMAVRWLGRNLFGEPTAVLLRRSVFEEFGWFNSNLYSRCDTEYWLRVATNTGTVHVPETLASFRVHAASASARYKQAARSRYRFEVMDPLLMLHDFAFDPHYASLRRSIALGQPSVDLRRELWRRALNAQWIAKRAASRPGGSDASLLDEWRRATEAYPRLTSIPMGARIRAKWRALTKSLPFDGGRGKRGAG